MTRRKTLFLGNGINRLNGAGASWEDVLRASAIYVGKPSIMSGWNEKSLPLLYEELYSACVREKKLKEFDLKKFVAGEVDKVASNEFHRQVITAEIRNVITTNYDLALEKCVESKWSKKNLHRETKYSRYRRNQVKNTNVWHIHGACDAPNTIQLGHEHYSGQLQNLRDLVVGFNRNTYSNTKSAFLQGIIDFDQSRKRYSWLDVFFRDDIHIIGLGLDFSEIDLWWAIAYKNRLKNGESRAPKTQVTKAKKFGSTTYHALEKAAEDTREKARQDVLRSLGVSVNLHPDSGSYRGMYTNVISLTSTK